MALTGDQKYNRRGDPKSSNEFGYPVAPGEIIYRGSLIGLNAAGYIQRVQTVGTIVFLGVSDRQVDNRLAVVAGPGATGQKGTWIIPVSGTITAANIGAPLYALDDNTLQLAGTSVSGTTTTTLLSAGTLSGLDNGLTAISIVGS